MSDLTVSVQLKADGSGLVGEVRLSGKELDKLSRTTKGAGKSADRAGRDIDRYEREMRQARFESRRLNEAQKNLKGTVLGLVGAYISLRSIGNLVDAYKQQDQAVAALDQSIKSMGRTTEGLTDQLVVLAAQVQREGVIGDEAIIQGQSFLTTYSQITDDLLPRTTRIMADIAAKMGGDTVQAANLLGKASMGMTGELARMGITLSDTAKKTKDFKLILSEIENQVGGMNRALRESETGPLDALGNTFGDLKEDAGALAVVFANEMVPALTRMSDGFSSALRSSRSFFVDLIKWRDEWDRRLISQLPASIQNFFGFLGHDPNKGKPPPLTIEITGGQTGPDQSGGLTDKEIEGRKKAFDKLRESLFSEEEQLALSYARRGEIIGNALQLEGENKITNAMEVNALLQQIEQEHQASLLRIRSDGLIRMEKFNRDSWKDQALATAQYMKGISSTVARENKIMFNLNKIAALSEGVLSLRESIMGAYKVGSTIGGPPLGAAFAAAAGAAQLANLQAIASASFGGGGGRGGSGGGGATPVFQANPVTNLPAQPEQQRSEQSAIQIIFQGDIYGWDDYIQEKVVEGVKDAVENRDVVIISRGSRNAQELIS